MHRTKIVLGLVAIVVTINAFPQQRQENGESPVIYIDFNYEGKPGEGKSLRSLDQVAYQDGVNRARSNLKDSYGNPVEYDTLENIDANKAGKDKNQFVIPGYASGILQPHEVPARSSDFNVETSRKIDDDKIHFIDPLQNSFQNSNKNLPTLQVSLAPPLGSDSNKNLPTLQIGLAPPLGSDSDINNSSITIPKPNIDLPETPQAPIDDPLNHELHPPHENSSQETPSISLQTPFDANPQFSLSKDLIPGAGQNIFIPRPNLDIAETPIDNSNSPLNQGLLPPNEFSKSFENNAPSLAGGNPDKDGPIIITDVQFAPKPSNGLLPPKDPSQNDINFQANFQEPTPNTQQDFTTKIGVQQQSSDKFTGSFGGAPGILGQAQPSVNFVQSNDKFTGSFGGSPGILGNRPASIPTQQHVASQSLIPVQVLQSPTYETTNKFGGSTGILGSSAQGQLTSIQSVQPTQGTQFTTQLSSSSNAPGRYQGTFGGSPGILTSSNLEDRIVGAQSNTIQQPAVLPTSATPPVGLTFNFGSTSGILGNTPVPTSQVPTTQSLSQLPSLTGNYSPTAKISSPQKYTGQFGGAPGILAPYDNTKN